MYFPTGLQLLQQPAGSDDPSLMISYGKDDNRAVLMTLGGTAVRECLKPIDGLDPKQYKFCTVGRG